MLLQILFICSRSDKAILQTTLTSKLVIETIAPERCRQTLEGSIDVRVAGLGRTAEKIIVQQLTKVYKSIPAIINKYAMHICRLAFHQYFSKGFQSCLSRLYTSAACNVHVEQYSGWIVQCNLCTIWVAVAGGCNCAGSWCIKMRLHGCCLGGHIPMQNGCCRSTSSM